jgi:hypothetical protein
MKLVVKELWSPDLDPPSEGLPPDVTKFRVYVNVAIAEADQPGTETFDFFVASPNVLQEGFLGTTLVLERFSSVRLRRRFKAFSTARRAMRRPGHRRCGTWSGT